MNPPPQGDEVPHHVPGTDAGQPPPQPLPEQEMALSPEAFEADSGFSGSGRLTFIASLILVTIAFSVGFSYLLQNKWPGRTAASDPAAAAGATALVADADVPIASNLNIPLQEEMFAVTAINLGKKRLAVVNGQKVEEGHALIVSTAEGATTVKVAKIEESAVHFTHGHQRIAARLSANVAQQGPP